MSSPDRPVVLITGASGVVGRGLLRELPDAHCIACVHSDARLDADEVLTCDIGLPAWGLGPERWASLAARVDVVVHSAGLTEWGQPKERYDAVNVAGTRHVVEFAQTAGAPIHFVSTAFVHALERAGAAAVTPDNVVLPYISSKLEAERLVVDSGLPYTIHRPTNLVGTSNTGWSHRPQIVQMLSDWIARGKAPCVPLHPGNLLDVAPLDALTVPLARMVHGATASGVYWSTYGDAAIGADESLELIQAYAARLGRTIVPPPVVDPSDVDLEALPPMARPFVRVLCDVSETTHHCGGVLPTSLPELQVSFDAPTVTAATAFERGLEYWLGERRPDLRPIPETNA